MIASAVKSSLHLSEISRNEQSIEVVLLYIEGELTGVPDWDNDCLITGTLQLTPDGKGDYKNINLSLKGKDDYRQLKLNFKVRYLNDDYVFLGKEPISNSDVAVCSDQRGGYRIDFYQDGIEFTATLYECCLNYNDWAIENGYDLMERNQVSVNTICEAFN